MSKVLIALVVCVTVVVIGVSAIQSQKEPDSSNSNFQNVAANVRYSVTFTGITKENCPKAQQAIEGISGVTHVELSCPANKGMVITKDGTEFTETVVNKALRDVRGVECKAIKVITGPGTKSVSMTPAPKGPVKPPVRGDGKTPEQK